MIAQYFIDLHKAETKRYIEFSTPLKYNSRVFLENAQQRLKCIEAAMIAIDCYTPEGATEVSDEHMEAVDILTGVIEHIKADYAPYDTGALQRVLAYLGTIY